MQRIVVVSIIGADRFSAGVYRSRLPYERAHLNGPIPARVLRAAQFHEFVELLMAWGRRDDVIHVPRMRTQLVAARTVAAALAELATDPEPVPPIHAAPIWEIAGPRAEDLVGSRGWSWPAAATRRGSRACPTPPIRIASSTSPAACCEPGRRARRADVRGMAGVAGAA